MSIDRIQDASAEGGVSSNPEQAHPVSGSASACEVHEADVRTASQDPSTGQDDPRVTGKDVRHEPAARSTNLFRLAPMGPMTKSGWGARVLQPSPTPGSMVGVGKQAEDRSLHQMLALTLGRLEEVLTKLSAPSVVDAPATPPEAVSAPDGPTTAEPEPLSTASAPTRRTWKWCPDLVPYVQQATRKSPLCDLDLQQAIRAKTGNLHSLPAIRKRIRRLVQEGKIDLYAMDRGGVLIPFPDHRTTLKAYIVWRGVCQAATLQPERPQTSPEPGCGGPIAEGTQDGLAPPSSHGATLDAEPDPVAETMTHEVPRPPKSLAWLLQQLGIRKISTQIQS